MASARWVRRGTNTDEHHLVTPAGRLVGRVYRDPTRGDWWADNYVAGRRYPSEATARAAVEAVAASALRAFGGH